MSPQRRSLARTLLALLSIWGPVLLGFALYAVYAWRHPDTFSHLLQSLTG